MGLPLSFAASSAFAPDGELGHRVLVLAGGLADDEGDIPRGICSSNSAASSRCSA